MKSAPLALAAVLTLTVAGCGGKAASTTPRPPTNSLLPPITVATLSGRLIAVGGSAGAPDTSLAGTITVTGPGGSVLHAPVGRTGAFQIQLSPGTYRLSGRSPQFGGGTTDCRTATPTTTLVAGRTVTADILCQRR
ncbi:MAG: hypothetical protein JWQ32_4 [Marmoricola sp.]|nr:hypothetical protein [Marmoricola sp.]